MNTCFVMQPFDGGKFDKRYRAIFAPAIRNANLEPYRVDQDPKVSIPIQDIERGIRDSKICFAEITSDNPNVWFELGYAIASGKEVVLVCSDERTTKFPFDIQHRAIIIYSTSSTSDFDKLKQDVTNKIKAFLEKADKLAEILTIGESRSNVSEEARKYLEEIRSELGKFKSEIPSVLKNDYLIKAIEEEKMRFYHNYIAANIQRDGYMNLSIKVLLGLPLSPDEMKEIADGQPYILRMSYRHFNPSIDVYNKDKQKIGSVLNTINEGDSKYFFDALLNTFAFDLLEDFDGFIVPQRCEFGGFYDHDVGFIIRFLSEMFPTG